MNAGLKAVYSLWLRDLRHFFRQRSRVLGAVGQPFVLWVFLSAGFKHSVSSGGMQYGAFLFPGVLLLIALFAAVFSTISVIEDRRSGFLQGVLAAPVGRPLLVLSKLLSGATLGLLQALLFLVVLPFTGLHLELLSIVAGLTVLFVSGLALTAFGFILSWRMSSTQGFHAVMNLLLVPMWVLSGAFFPADGASSWLQAIIALNPMHYMYTLFRATLFGTSSAGDPGIMLSALVTGMMLVLLTGVSMKMAERS